MYIALEGVVGTGKTTQATKLYEFLKLKFPNKKVILTREPGGTQIAENIRKIVQGTEYNEEMDVVCEAYLYAAARAQSLRKIVKPVLDSGGIVVSDRTFLSSLAYQGFVRSNINLILDINKKAIEGFYPDTILFLDLDPKKGLMRTFDKDGDKWEKLDVTFFEKVKEGYLEISKMPEFSKKWINIDATGNINDVFFRIKNKIMEILP
jgi:dTMP kinase